jgi:ADP-heptose:LPS heptosyltransferase
VTDAARAQARVALGAGDATWVAIHCRQAQLDGDKNPHGADCVEVARRLCDLGVRIVLLGADSAPAELRAHADLHATQDDASLQSTAALLESCAALVGGDSGPVHLAAAVGTPVLCVVAPDRHAHGPFAPIERIERIVGRRDEPGGALRFNGAHVASLVSPRLRRPDQLQLPKKQ